VGSNPVDVPLVAGDKVEEIFGLPPFLPLSVLWTCETSDVANGRLTFYSEKGLAFVAKNCRMTFDIRDEDRGGCSVNLAMDYEPVSLLAVLGAPALALDNTLALKVFLPRAFS